MKSRINQLIKIVSTAVIIGALGLGCWNFYLYLQGESLPNSLVSLYRLGMIILIAHSIEALIVAVKASQNPLNYAVYTFFVGFVGLQELLDSQSSAEKNN